MLVSANSIEASDVSAVSQAFARDNAAGNLLIAFVRNSFGATAMPAVSDTARNRYVQATSQVQTADGHGIAIFYVSSSRAGANTVTAAFAGSNNHPWMAIFEYSGVHTLDQVGQEQGGDASPSCATGTTTAARELVVAGLGMLNSSDVVVLPGEGYLLGLQDSGSSRAATETLVSSAAGSFSGAFTLGEAVNWSCVSATFK